MRNNVNVLDLPQPHRCSSTLWRRSLKVCGHAEFSSKSSRISRRKRSKKCGSSSSLSISPASPLGRPVHRFGRPKTYFPSDYSFFLPDFGLELAKLLDILPKKIRKAVSEHEDVYNLVEVVMDLGRKPLARFPSGDWTIIDNPVTSRDLNYTISLVGDFGEDNRAVIDSSLHRISAIRNRVGRIIGLTCRLGRAVPGSGELVRDLVKNGGSILVIGPPGVGKTTLIREIARMIADDYKKRTVVIDTSNEIAGDGDIPHVCIGRARRMQVPSPDMQHKIMVEAVENHMPEALIIDEIGTEVEAWAARTIAERGIQLVGSAHGMCVENLMKNPSLEILVGGIQSVTITDDEAKRRKARKTILERKGPLTFAHAVEMRSKTECIVHHNLEATVDDILAGRTPFFEVREIALRMNKTKSLAIQKEVDRSDFCDTSVNMESLTDFEIDNIDSFDIGDEVKPYWTRFDQPLHLYVFQSMEANTEEVLEALGLGKAVVFENYIGMADVILISESELKQNLWIKGVSKYLRRPIFVIQSNTMTQIMKAIQIIFGIAPLGSRFYSLVKQKDENDSMYGSLRDSSSEMIDAMQEARLAIEYIVIPTGQPVELLPRSADVIDHQIKVADSYQLLTMTSGTQSDLRLQILPFFSNHKETTVFV